jgi:hypothetical protein
MLQGVLHPGGVIWSMFITNAVTCACSGIIFAIKIHNDYLKRKKNTKKQRNTKEN